MITIKESVLIRRSAEVVWDYTQDYNLRPTWDRLITGAITIESEPPRVIEVFGQGNWSAIFRYKLDDRPNKSSLVMDRVQSRIFAGGGGSWKYEESNGVTRWEQTNTILLKPVLLIRLFRSLIAWIAKIQTRQAMLRVKFALESKADIK